MFQYLLRPRRHCIILAHRTVLFIPTKTITYERRMRQLYDDGIDLKQQTVEMNPIDHTRRCSLHKNDDIWTFYKANHPRVLTLGDALNEGHINSNDGPCVGILQSSNDIGSLQWLSYSQVMEKCRRIGSYLWIETKLTPMQSKVAILSSNRAEFLFVEQACYQYGFIVVGIYTTYDSKNILKVLQDTQAEVLVVDNLERIQTFKDDLLNNNQIKEILVMDDGDYGENSKIRSVPTIIKSINNSDIRERPIVDPDSIASLILTSGTTGEPKLAMISHENLLAAVKANLIRLDRQNMKRPITNIHCSFLPAAHVFEKFVIFQILLKGTALVFCPAPENLVEYLSIVKPTQASVVPRVLNKVYDAIVKDVNKSAIKKYLVQQALREQPPFLSHFVFRKVRALFGGKLQGIITASAPMRPDVMHFFRIALNIPIIEGYGQTETCTSGTSTNPIDMSYGTIGSPGPSAEIKLIDVSDTNYRSDNNQGEICIRGPAIFKGYYGDEVKTKEAIDQDGWLHTGDIGEWTTNGALRIIDRAKHIFKLSQGKYIAPERLEDIYVRSPWIEQIFIDGISTEVTIVAIVIPDEQYVRKNFQAIDTETTFADLCMNKKLKDIILSDLIRLAKKHKLEIYETLSNIHLHSELFTQSNGLITGTFKTRRNTARKYFQSIIKSLYQADPTAMASKVSGK
ncbi:unnamed protein product [Rotaria socialis]|uniref:long-chain-fatty-acid--CoA ligase n=2 Tax=Rotaria socialis TaxID=392032 RepID=A0A817SDW5_9BILA|nr:unnamed protein product [Rotaria socialis]CAF3604388.1 unnamed protein product [Rotaria socialis]CAF4274809.1 unnamed protein product [Rotaria socialis]